MMKKTTFETLKRDPWLTLALDPFHDYNVPVQGLPDDYAEATTVQLVNRSLTLTKPPDLPAGATWDCHIATLPISATTNSRIVIGGPISGTDHSTNPNFAMGTVTVSACQTGARTFPNTLDLPAVWTAVPRYQDAVSGTDNNNNIGMNRIIGGGFEVHNDTSSMYKNGSVTTYSMPSEQSLPHNYFLAQTIVGAGTRPLMAKTCREPPETVQQARSYRSSQTWEAEQGVLVPFRLDVDNSNFKPYDPNCHYFRDIASGANSGGLLTDSSSYVVGDMLFEGPTTRVRDAAITTSGAYFTGLDERTVLTLTAKFILEVAPSATDAALLATASPSAEYEPRVLECYKHCVRRLKPAVPVSMNERGDWWRMALKVMKDVAPEVLGSIGSLSPRVKTANTMGLPWLVNKGLDFALTNSERRAAERRGKPAAKPAEKKRVVAKGPVSQPNNTFRRITAA